MAMFRYSTASVVRASIQPNDWTDKVYKDATANGQCRMKTAKSIIAKYSPDKYLLSHCTIVAAVETDLADPKDPNSDYLIKPEFSNLINNNGDAWTKAVLKNSYQTFIGGENFLEHVQLPELSKGKIIDAVLREIPIGKDKESKELTSYYCDILVATNRKNEDLVRKIESKELTSLSMGCFWAGTEITMSDGTKKPIECIVPGDLVLTHNGVSHPVMNTQKKWYEGPVLELEVEGDYKKTFVTPEHPFWAFIREQECACGCGEKIHIKLTGHKNNFNGKDFEYSQYKRGHYARLVNPNKKTYSIEDYQKRKENNCIKNKIDLSWVKAGNLKVGDLISYPISKEEIHTADATVEKARLIGYFLAEGSFVKEMVACGEENDYGIRCRICGNIYNRLDTHLSKHKMTLNEYRNQFPGAPVKAKINKQLIRLPRKHSIEEDTGFIRKHHKIGAEFSLGKHEYSTLNAEIAELAKIVFPESTVLRYEESVKIIGEGVSDFFVKYCGEYFDHKRVPEEVLFWPKNIQKHIIATWILGDYASTSSKYLFSQMHYIFIRNKVWHNTIYKEAHPYHIVLKNKTVNGGDTEKTYDGIRVESFMLQLTPRSFNAVVPELNHAFEYHAKKFQPLSSLAKNSWKNVQDLGWLTRKITSIKEVPFEGWVYNFEVDKDNSYIANDIAVHNCLITFSICSKCGNRAKDETEACEHIRYQKGNTFFDHNGSQRKIAELCGHFSVPESVKFIEASWVKQPAFTGAVLRSFVAPSEEIMAKLEKAEKIPSYKKKPGDYLKAAGLVDLIAQEPPAKEDPPEPPADAPAEEPEADTPAEPPADAPEAPVEDVTPDDDEGAVPEEEDDISVWKKDLKKQVLRQITDEVLKDLSGEGDVTDKTDILDETLIRPASLTLNKVWGANKSWDRFIRQKAGCMNKKSYDKLRYGVHMAMTNNDLMVLKDFGYNRREFLAVLSFIDGCMKNPLPLQVKKTIARLGSSQNRTVRELLSTVVSDLGRKVTQKEAQKILAWLRMLDFYN